MILGRTGRTERNLPATLAGVLVNVALNLLLVPEFGIVGAGVALIVSYGVVIALMYAFTQRLFPIPWQWGRLAVIALAGAALVVAGELALPDDGFTGLVLRAALPPPLHPRSGRRDRAEERATAVAARRTARTGGPDTRRGPHRGRDRDPGRSGSERFDWAQGTPGRELPPESLSSRSNAGSAACPAGRAFFTHCSATRP